LIALPLLPDDATKVCPDKVIARYLCAPYVCDNVQKLVTLLVIQAIVAVHGLEESLMIFPDDGSKLPVIACTRTPVIVRVSDLLAFASVEKVAVIVEAVTATDAAVISLHAV